MKLTNTLILAAMAAFVTIAAPQGPVTADAELSVPVSGDSNISSDTCDCKGCEDFFNHCLKSRWCWINPKCTLSCSGDTCRSGKCCRNHCRWGDYC